MTAIRVNETVSLQIKKIGINGEGIGYINRTITFVPGALPFEEVLIKIKKVQRNYIEGQLLKILKPSRDRIRPKCEYFGKCGGCQLQHLDYRSQLKHKREIIIDSINKYTNHNPYDLNIKETIGMKYPYGYRNKAQLPVMFDGEELVTGLYEVNSRRLIFIDECPIEHNLVNKIVDKTKEKLDKYHVRAFNKKTNEGIIRFIVVRIGVFSNEAQVTVVVYKNSDKKLNVALKELYKDNPGLKSVYINVNNNIEEHEILGEQLIKVAGSETITDNLGDLKYQLSPRAFYQLNPTQTVNLYNEVKKVAQLTGKEKVIDAYCGVGTIGLWLAKDAKEVRGVDITRNAIKDAKNNAVLNNIDNVNYAVGKAEDVIIKWINSGWQPDILVIDPPRVGIDSKLLEFLKRVKIPKIIYISCNPSTLAKNLKELSKKYEIKNIQPVDMFPQTSHVESVTLLTIK